MARVMARQTIRSVSVEFVDYFWPRVFIFTALYWLAVLTGMFKLDNDFLDLRSLAKWMTKLTSMHSILIFLIVSGFFCLLEFLFRLFFARKGRLRHWFFTRTNRLSVVGLEIFLGLLSVTSVLSLNILVHLSILGDRYTIRPEDQWLRGDQIRNSLLALAVLIVLFFYKAFVVGREDKLTKRFKARK